MAGAVHRRPALVGLAALALAATGALAAGGSAPAAHASDRSTVASPVSAAAPLTKIKHVVVLFGENISYDHYFGTYPRATNKNGVKFHPRKNTPRNNNLRTAGLLGKTTPICTPRGGSRRPRP